MDKKQKIIENIGPTPIFLQLDTGDSALVLSAPTMIDFHSLVGLLMDFEEVSKRLGKYERKVEKK